MHQKRAYSLFLSALWKHLNPLKALIFISLLHVPLGAATGAILDGKDGALSGAVGALAAKSTATMMEGASQEMTLLLSRVAAVVATGALGLDPALADRIATNAVVNNSFYTEFLRSENQQDEDLRLVDAAAYRYIGSVATKVPKPPQKFRH